MANAGLQPVVIAIVFLCPALSGLIVAVRLYRKRLDRTFGADDVLIAVAWLLSIANSVLTLFYVKAAYVGYHTADVPKNLDRVHIAKLLYAITIIYNPVLCLVKASFLWSLQKLHSPRTWVRRSLWIIQGINATYLVASLFSATLPCIPVRKKWHPTTPGHCSRQVDQVIGTITVVIITDVLVLVMPTWIIYDLQMPLMRKITTIAFLSLGVVVTAIGVLRLVWLVNKFRGNTNTYSVQQTYSALECNLAIIGASGPTIRWLLGFCVPCLAPTKGIKQASYPYNSSTGENATIGRSKTRHTRKFVNEYDDLDTVEGGAGNDDVELRNDWRWKKQPSPKVGADTDSDEQRITGGDDGITKTVDWNISTGEPAIQKASVGQDTKSVQSDSRVAVNPADVV